MKDLEGLATTLCVFIAVVGCNRPGGRDTPAESQGGSAKSQRQPDAPNDRLALPGWQDLLVGNELPADARQNCTDKDTDGSQLPQHEKMCKGCRSAELPTPCVEVMSLDDGKHAEIISAVLPIDNDQQAAKIVDALHARWGAATSRSGTPPQAEFENWGTSHESIQLVTMYDDFSNCSPQDFENNTKCGRVSKRPQRRVVMISSPVTPSPQSSATTPATNLRTGDQSQQHAYEFGTKRCGGTAVLQLIAQLQYQNLDPPPTRTCIYDVGVMSVVGQTRDGWTMATLSSFGAAFRADRAYVNGAMIRDKRAIFLGVEPFEMANGGGQNIATFELTDTALPGRQAPSRENDPGVGGRRAMPSSAEPVRSDVERLLNAQAASLTSTADAFVGSYSDSAIAFFPQSLVPFEGRAKIIEGSRQAWRLHGTPGSVKTSAVSVGVAGSVAWATTTWTITLGDSSTVMPVRVTEILSRDANGLLVTAASFSVPPPPDSPGIYETPPGFGSGVAPTQVPEGWLATPAQLAQSILSDPATSLIGSDLKEYALGGDTVRKLLTSWKNVRLELVGNVRIVDGEGYKMVLAFARWPGPKPTLFRVLALFVRGEAIVSAG